MLTRRNLLRVLPFAWPASWGWAWAPQAAPPTRLNLAVLDRERILKLAARALSRVPKGDSDAASPGFLDFAADLPALAAAVFVDPQEAPRYCRQASTLLQTWLLSGAASLPAEPKFATFEPIAERAALAEIAVAIPFFSFEDEVLAPARLWFKRYVTYLLEARTALLARDARDHHGSSWLLQVAALARLLGDEPTLVDLRHRFRAATLRAEINAEGFFPRDLRSPNPFRDSLFNLDLLAGACVLLATRFESAWDAELPDGPGMRAAIARHAPYMRDRKTWPYRADLAHFNDLPGRRASLLFAARAYQQPEYAALWQTLEPDPAEPEILRTLPIRQPILWLNAPPRHLSERI